MISDPIHRAAEAWKKCRRMALSPRLLTCLVLTWHILTIPAGATVQWPQLKYTTIASLTQPVQVTNAADGSNRIFIVTLPGTVRIYQGGQLLTTPFLDISARVYRGESAEAGCFSVAFPPNYASKGYFYIAYARSSDGAVVLSRFTVPSATPNVANATSEQVLLAVPHPNTIHYGGQLAFGPDGYLYMSLGDGGPEDDPSNNAQNPSLLLGKILRINTENGVSPYAVPPTNPFVGVTGTRPEIWALGLRNPWRFSFDRGTGDLYIADVGQNLWEEMDYQAAGSAGGQNYGWRILEGTHPYNVPNGYNISTLTPPVIQYPHQGSQQYGNAIIGGVVYRGPASRLTGIYLYADFGLGTIYGATQDGGNWVTQTFDNRNEQFSSFGEDESGQVYVTDVYQGSVWQIQEDTVSRTPTFNFSPGDYSFDLTVTCTTTTPNAVVHYTTNGVAPTINDPVFPTAGLPVTGPGITLLVCAFHPYYSQSAVAGGNYTFTVATPFISGTVFAIDPSVGKDITVSESTPNATTYYTLDGSTPTTASTPVTGGTVHLTAGPVTIKAAAFLANYQPSAVASGTWGAAQIATPVIVSYAVDTVTNGVLAFTGPGQIHYTLDGTTPTASSPLYTGPVLLTEPATVNAIAFGTNYSPSSVLTESVTLYDVESTSSVVASGYFGTGFVDSTTYTSVLYRSLGGICVDPRTNTFYVADAGNHAIRRGTPFGPVTTLAGNGTAGYVNAAGTAAQFNFPLAVCLDPAGNLYVADYNNNVVRKIDPAANVTTYAGSGDYGNVDGPGPQAQFYGVCSLAMDAAGNLFVGTNAGKIRKVDPQQNVTTFATLPYSEAVSLTITADGRMFAVAPNYSSGEVFQVSASGAVSVIAGTGAYGSSDGNPTTATFENTLKIASDAQGILYVIDNTDVRKIGTDGMVSTFVKTGVFSNPSGISAGPGGHVFITDNGGGVSRIYMVSPNPSWPFAAQLATDGAGNAVVTWPSTTGRNYAVYYSDDLQTWTYTGSLYPGTGSAISITQPLGGSAHRFFKVKAL